MTLNSQKKIGSIPLAIALCVLAIGSLLKIQHWSFGFELKLTSLIAIGVLYALQYGFKPSKNTKDTAKALMVLSWVLLNVFAQYKLNNLIYMRIILEVSGSTWLALEVWDTLRKKPKTERANFLQLIGMFIMIVHAIFAIQRWPFTGPILGLSLFALVMLAIGFLLDSKSTDETKVDFREN